MNQPTIKIDGMEINQTTPYIDYDAWIASPLTKALKDKLEAAVAAEREACAKLCEDIFNDPKGNNGDDYYYTRPYLECADAIRARGEKE